MRGYGCLSSVSRNVRMSRHDSRQPTLTDKAGKEKLARSCRCDGRIGVPAETWYQCRADPRERIVAADWRQVLHSQDSALGLDCNDRVVENFDFVQRRRVHERAEKDLIRHSCDELQRKPNAAGYSSGRASNGRPDKEECGEPLTMLSKGCSCRRRKRGRC